MYNAHRGGGMGSSNATNSNNRLSDLFDQIRREFEVHAQDRAGEHDQNSTFVDCSQVIREGVSAAQICNVPLHRYCDSCRRSLITVALP